MKLSIIIPVFNEEKTIAQVIKRVSELKIPSVEKEIIIVNDGSTDATASEISDIKYRNPNFKIITLARNQGKGAAVITGIKGASGDYIAVQDADLEYNPADFIRLVKPIKEGRAQVTYGTRLKRMPNFLKEEKTPQFLLHYLGNKALSLITSILYGQWITDMETCYKVFPRGSVGEFSLRSRGFEFEPEITSKLLKNGYRILEIPISTNPRGYSDGKKLNTFKDGVKALSTLIKYRFIN